MTTDPKDTGGPSVERASDSIDDAVLSGLISRLGSDTLRYVPAVILPAVIGVLSISIFTRIFTPEAYGEYSLVYAVVAMGTSILAGWLQQSVHRYLPRFRADGRIDEFLIKLASILWTVAVLMLVILLPLQGWARSSLGEYGRYYVPAAAWTAAGVLFFVMNHAFSSNLQPGKFARYQVAYAVGRLSFALIFVYVVSRDVVGLIIGGAVAYLILLWPMSAELGLFRGVRSHGPAIDLPLLKKFVRYGFPVIGFALGVKVLDLSDRFMIELFRTSDEVGIYSANYTLVSMGVIFVAAPILNAALPLIMNAWEQGHEGRIQEVISSFSRYYLILAVPVVVFTIVFGHEIVTVFLGEAFREGFTIIPYILFGYLLWNFAMYGHKAIKLLEKTGIMFLLVTICCAVNILLNLLVVPRYGYHGAAVTTLISLALYPVMVYWTTRRYLSWIIPWVSVFRILVAGAVGSLGWLGIRLMLSGRLPASVVLLVGFPIGLALYLGTLVLTRELRDYEARLIGLGRRG